jgi:hypothetical protein
MTKHKHADLIYKWADGAQIQWYDDYSKQWKDSPQPAWDEGYEYRIKPENYYIYDVVGGKNEFYETFHSRLSALLDYKINNAFYVVERKHDYATGELISCEVIASRVQ